MMEKEKLSYIPLGTLRFYLAFVVFLGHAFAQYGVLRTYRGVGLETSGVAVFFVVSGYVVISAFCHFYHNAPFKFLINRCLRIFPPFWVIYGSTLLALWLVDPKMIQDTVTLTKFVSNLTLMGAYLQKSSLLHIGQAWTLIVEVHFYLVAIILFTGLSAYLATRSMVLAYFAVSMVAYIYIVMTSGYTRFYGGAQYAPFFALGGAIYCYHQRIFSRKSSWLIMIVWAGFSVHSYNYYLESIWPNNPYQLLGILLYLMPVAAFIFLSGQRLDGLFGKIDRGLGDLTYHLYLSHLGVLKVLHILGYAEGWLGVFLTFTISIAVSWLFFLLTDKPLRALRTKFRGHALLS